jgi:hypothetical protein
MNKALLERNIAAVLFVLVLVVFSFAERDTKKITELYRNAAGAKQVVRTTDNLTTEPIVQVRLETHPGN